MRRPQKNTGNPATKHSIELDGKEITYAVKHSTRARYVRLVIRPEAGLTVTIPSSCFTGQLPDILRARSGWILKKLAEYAHSQPPYTKEELETGDKVPYLGGYLTVELRATSSIKTRIDREGNNLVISRGQDRKPATDALRAWYRAQAKAVIKEKATGLSNDVGVTFNRLTIRGQKTLWGSCSRKGTLSFNWKLIMTPEPVMEYVIIHELVHLRTMNHGKTFWKQVERYCPQWREHKRWLKEHGFRLSTLLPVEL
jgi:predicted metal-dependent hydrolase